MASFVLNFLVGMINAIQPIITSKLIEQKYIISWINILFLIILFGILSFYQLKKQPYYSCYVNNYKFSIYFGLFFTSVISEIILLILHRNTGIFSEFIPLILAISFCVGYKLNSLYYNKTIKRVYKLYHDKKVINNLKDSINNDKDDDEYDNEEGEEGEEGREVKKQLMKIKDEEKMGLLDVDKIVTEKFIRREIKLYKNNSECEMACRFLRNNRDINAFYLMKELFEEGMKQFKHNPDVFIAAWYSVHSMKIFYKNNEHLSKYDISIFNGDEILEHVSRLKIDMRIRFLITNAYDLVEKERREMLLKKTDTNVEKTLKLENLKNEAAMIHYSGLNHIKNLLTALKGSKFTKEILSYRTFINDLNKAQENGNRLYKNILKEYPDDKDTMKLYTFFLLDVYEIKNLRKNSKGSNSKNELNNKKEGYSLNSLNSNTHSEDYSAVSGLGREIRKKIASK
ncbi:hypothetical protein BCR32DRAFT_242552 [Anaeromyces robustus]|uniref:RGS domain-containing protein n=1 Tax=Anaeromyces robustus TaxID=1754192 RepID=A0A1Y1XGH3_9FUNG|nr:hypothetical protein BCR32DRAFT_242552 [Anaeromyces robustus]|eukprot:ORX84506.1 hypothetical protein BCR32DRAFT_242552 [Anaeromyces robustus]